MWAKSFCILCIRCFRSISWIPVLGAAAAMAFTQLAWSGPVAADVTVEFSDGVNTALKNVGESPKAQRQDVQRDFNDGLKELAKTNNAAKVLFNSNQTIRIVCYGVWVPRTRLIKGADEFSELRTAAKQSQRYCPDIHGPPEGVHLRKPTRPTFVRPGETLCKTRTYR